MLTGDIRNQIDQIWNAFWAGGIANPLEVIEQITYLLFLKRLDELEIAEELKANREKKPLGKRFFPEGEDDKKRLYQDFRWNRFKNFDSREMYTVVSEHVFPWLRTLGGNGTTYSKHMEGARFTIPSPSLLAKVVDMIDKVPMEDRDTKGDLYEYMLGKIASAGQNGQFRTPRHIIRLMVEMVEPKPMDIVCDPACGTCGFLVAVGESLRERHPEVLLDAKLRQHFHRDLFHGSGSQHIQSLRSGRWHPHGRLRFGGSGAGQVSGPAQSGLGTAEIPAGRIELRPAKRRGKRALGRY
jgi:type I restriction enzyme M protein